MTWQVLFFTPLWHPVHVCVSSLGVRLAVERRQRLFSSTLKIPKFHCPPLSGTCVTASRRESGDGDQATRRNMARQNSTSTTGSKQSLIEPTKNRIQQFFWSDGVGESKAPK
jgi:hypothetical protein